ncbi:colanic acid biosynthesis glycosyltransferase WcaL [soil metagenome]
MRITFVLPSFPELSETFLLRQVTGLLDRGHDVRILAHRPPVSRVHHPEVEERALLGRTRYLSRTMEGVGQVSNFGTSVPWGRAGRIPRAVAEAKGSDPSRSWGAGLGSLHRVGALAAEPAPDIVHCHYGETGLQYGFAARLWGCPLVVSFYGYDCSSYPRHFGPGVYEPLFQRASRVLVLGEAMAVKLGELGCPPARLGVQPLSVDLTRFVPPDPPRTGEGGLRILTVARLVEKKGIGYALDAVAPLVREFPGTEYRIAGDGPLLSDLRKRAEGLGLQESVKFMGPLAEPEIVRAMQEADIFLLPSVTGEDGDQEGTPTVLLEAAACGLPVVSTLHAGIPEITRNGVTALLVPERDTAGLQGSLRTLLEDPEKRGRMGRAARSFVESRHGVDQVSERLEDVYSSVLSGDRRNGGRP